MVQARKNSFAFRLIASIINICFIFSYVAPLRSYAQTPADLGLPVPGTMISLTPAYVPVMAKGLRLHPENPLLFDFIIDTGNSGLNAQDPVLKTESEKIIKYFLASLTIPDNDQWVNLSPYEKDRIIPEQLGLTEMGMDMLAQDYILKQLTASLIYPEKKIGKEFWNKVYTKARQLYGTSEVPVNTFNKVWIVADKADIYVRDNTAFVQGAHLKVMLEEDYLSLNKHNGILTNNTHGIGNQIIRQIVLPELEKEVNTGRHFANLRQIFYSMILATWYKKNLKEALLNQVYSNRSKINGVNVKDKTIKEQIYQAYLKAYKKGVFNYIKEDIDQSNKQPISRKYFSGGLAIERGIQENLTQQSAGRARGDLTLTGPTFLDERIGIVKEISSVPPSAAMTVTDAKRILNGATLVIVENEGPSLSKVVEMTMKPFIGETGKIVKIGFDENDPESIKDRAIEMVRSMEEKIKKGEKVVFITDVNLTNSTNLEGLEVAKACKAAGIPVVAWSGNEDYYRQEFAEAGIMLLAKPGGFASFGIELAKQFNLEAMASPESSDKLSAAMTGMPTVYHTTLSKGISGAPAVWNIERVKAVLENLPEGKDPKKMEFIYSSEVKKWALDYVRGNHIEDVLKNVKATFKINDYLAQQFLDGIWLTARWNLDETFLREFIRNHAQIDDIQLGKLSPKSRSILISYRKDIINDAGILWDRWLAILNPNPNILEQDRVDQVEGRFSDAVKEKFKEYFKRNGLSNILDIQVHIRSGEGRHIIVLISGNSVLPVHIIDRHLNGLNRILFPFQIGEMRSQGHVLILQLIDAAMLPQMQKAVVQERAPGGIDLNSSNMAMSVTGDKINMRFDPAMAAQFRRGDFSGVRPKILDITPIASVFLLLGLKD